MLCGDPVDWPGVMSACSQQEQRTERLRETKTRLSLGGRDDVRPHSSLHTSQPALRQHQLQQTTPGLSQVTLTSPQRFARLLEINYIHQGQILTEVNLTQ